MQPVRNNILTKPFPPDEISEGGIFVPESARKENNKMFVIAVGRGTKERKMIFNPGDIVYRVKDWGTPIDKLGRGDLRLSGRIRAGQPQVF